MQCPNCGENITENDTVCPKCKKVLKLICPICHTANTKKVCSKCGHHIITKCYKCSKVIQTSSKLCPNCKTNTYYSLFLNTSNTEEFAVFTIEFSNLDKIKWSMGEKKYNKFIVKLHSAIKNILGTKELTIEKDKNTYYVACNRNSSYKTSMQDAIKLSIDILSLIARINVKITKYTTDTVKCVITMSKLDSFSDNREIISYLDLYANDEKKISSLTEVQLLLDFQIYSNLKDTLEYNFISSTYKNNKEIMLFNINIKKYIDLSEIEKLKGKDIVSGRYKLPEFKEDLSYINLVNEKNAYNQNLINFKTIKCKWDKIDAYELKEKISCWVKNDEKFFVSYSAPTEYSISESELYSIFQDSENKKIHTIVCTNKMKYEPYGLLKRLLLSLYNVKQLEGQELSDLYNFTFAAEDRNNYISSLLNNKIIEKPNSEQVHEEITKALYNLIKNQPNVVIYIKNFENVDETSKIVFEHFVNNFEILPLSWIISLNSSTKLHDIYKELLLNSKYYEVTMLPMPFKKIMKQYIEEYSEAMDSYFMNRIAVCAKGSLSFVNLALKYLKLENVFKSEQGKLVIDELGSVVIPANLIELIKKRLNTLKQYPQEMNVYLFSLLSEDLMNIKALKEAFPTFNLQKILQNLETFGFITKEYQTYRIEEYNLSLKCAIETIERDTLANIISILTNNSITMFDFPLKAYCAEIIGNKTECLNTILNNIELNSSLGDYYAMLHTIRHFLSLLKQYDISDSDEGIKEKKDDIYWEIVKNAQHYNPEHISDIINVVADKLNKQSNNNALFDIYKNTLKSCLDKQHYVNAYHYLQNILTLNQEQQNKADGYIFLALKVDILYNLGYTKTAMAIGFELFDCLSIDFIKENRKVNFFNLTLTEIIKKCIYDMCYMVIFENRMKIAEFKTYLQNKIDITTIEFELFEMLEQLLRNKPYKLTYKETYKKSDEAEFLYHILKAYTFSEDMEEYANEIYSASLIATKIKNIQEEYICNLLIAYSYLRLENIQKAKVILDIIQEKANKKGLININYLNCYIFVLLEQQTTTNLPRLIEFLQTILQKIESDENVCLYINVMFKRLCASLLEQAEDKNKAKYYIDTAKEMFN